MDSTMSDMKPSLAADEMFPEGAYIDIEDSGSVSGVLMDVSNDKHVHADFYEDFGDLYDESDFEL